MLLFLALLIMAAILSLFLFLPTAFCLWLISTAFPVTFTWARAGVITMVLSFLIVIFCKSD